MTPPAASPPEVARWVGLYGTDRPILDIYERDGGLFAHGCGLDHVAVAEVRDRLGFSEGKMPQAQVDGLTLEQRDFAGEAVAAFRRTVSGDLNQLRAASLAATPPRSDGAQSDLVDVSALVPGIRVDMRYASANNFMGAPLYDRAVALLQRPAAAALARAQAALREHDYALVVLDAYRPWSVTWLFWAAVPPASRTFIADPAIGSKHNRGCAVDVTLVHLANGQPVDMPSGYDEPSVRAGPTYHGGTSRARWHRDLLRGCMERAGFTVDPHEWWHYDFDNWAAYPILNVPLARLA